MRTLISPLISPFIFVIALIGGSSSAPQRDDLEITGRVLDAESRLLLPNIRVDVIDVASGDTLAADIRTDSLGQFATMISVTAVEPVVSRPDQPTLVSAYPSPASSGDVRLAFRAPVGSRSPTIEVFDTAGRQVGGSVTAAGVYFVRLSFDDGVVTNTRTVVKLPGDPIAFRLDRLPDAVDETSVAKSSSAQAIRLAYSHPAYSPLAQEYDTGETLTDLSVEVEPYFVPVTADEVTFDVTYDEDAVVIEGAARAALVEADTVHQVYRFETAVLATEGIVLTAGSPMIIEGLALRRITSVAEDGDQTIVETEFVELTEAISDGTISWHHAASLDAAALKLATMAGKSGELDPEGLKLKFKYKEGDYDYVVQFELSPSDTVRTEVIVQVTKKVDGNLKATFTGKGRLKSFESDGNIEISNNEADAVSISNDNVRLEMELSIAAAGSGLGSPSWKMPEVGLPIRFVVGTIPVTINVRVQVEVKMTVQNEASATATTTMSYDGNTGFSYEDSISVNHQTINHLFHGTNADSGANIGNFVDAQLGIAFPKIDVEIFAVPIVPNFLVGFIVGTSLTWGPVCKSGYTKIDIKAGADFKLLKLSAKLADKLLWTDKTESAPC